jgi:hypothetical protein
MRLRLLLEPSYEPAVHMNNLLAQSRKKKYRILIVLLQNDQKCAKGFFKKSICSNFLTHAPPFLCM